MKLLNWSFRLILLIPFGYYAWLLYSGRIGGDPAKFLNHKMGQIALYYLFLNLVIGALLAYSFRFPKWLRFLPANRRWLGVVTFIYLIFHFLLYLTMEGFERKGFIQIVEKTYLILGISSWLILFVLALTSNNWSVRKMGAKIWKKLHRTVYLATALVAFHVLLIEKADLIFYGVLFFLLASIEFPRLFLKMRRTD